MVEEYQVQAIPVALVIDHEGYIVAKESSEHQQVAGRILMVQYWQQQKEMLQI